MALAQNTSFLTEPTSVKKALFIFIFAAVGHIGFAQKKPVIGRVIDDNTQKGVDKVLVINKRTLQRTQTNRDGVFFIYARENDSIIVSKPAQGRAGIKWDGATLEPTISIKLKPLEENLKTIDLKEIEVRSMRESELKKELELVLSEPTASKNLSGDQVLDLVQSPISLLYEAFSRRARSDRKVLVLMQQDRRRKLANFRLDMTAVNVTDLRGEELERFMKFCDPDETFILSASEYDLTYRILQCFKGFKRKQ